MSTTPYYDKILATMPEGIERDVYCVIRDYVGKEHAITLPALALVIFGKDTETCRRQIREAIENLHNEYSVPVCSNSGRAGRYMPANQSELDEYLAEMRSRAAKELKTVSNLERCAWFTKPQHHIPASFEGKQLTLLPEVRAYA